MKNLKKYFPVLLFMYHILFSFLAWKFISSDGGDALNYWFVGRDLSQIHWEQFFNPGTDTIKVFTFPLVKYLNLPFWLGLGFFQQ